MHIPKKYGSYKIDYCPFCRKNATTKNPQKVPVCHEHKKSILKDLTCFCGDYLDLKDGKYGIYFTCMNCGNFNLKKALEMNPELEDVKQEKKKRPPLFPTKKKEITITSDEVDTHYS